MKKYPTFLQPSTKAFIKEAWNLPSFTLGNWFHGYFYGRWPYLYIGIGKGTHALSRSFRFLISCLHPISRLFPRKTQKEITFSDTYHGKVVPLDQARKLVTVNREIVMDDLEQVIPYNRARSIILKNPDHIVALDCPCRISSPSPCSPIDVCLIIGEPFASFINEHHPDRSRRISSNEAVAILEAEHKRGHVHHAFFKEAMLNRFYAICNCCSCCCGAINALKHGTPMLASSGYTAFVKEEDCIKCGICNKFCQFEAIEYSKQSGAKVDTEQCLGCGVCVDKCKSEAIILKRTPEKGIPLEIEKLFDQAIAAENS